ncbi:MAG: zinc ribbon domain-containing protein [Firmicutes bacterium]|nr:zinc ribbon domain-containing protein [Bacillota bacterium]
MTKCKQCNVIISDDISVCPLCRCAVESGDSIRLNEYPDVRLATRRMKHVCNIILLAVLAASAVLIICNIAFYSGSWWSVIPVAALLYVCFVFRLLTVSSKGYRIKVFLPMILAGLLMLIIDMETGFYRWSLNYVFPAEILLADVIILILMLTNLKNWQSYIIMEIAVTAAAAAMLVLWAAGLVTSPVISIIALGVSALMTAAAVIIGDRTARSEIKRRFHIR